MPIQGSTTASYVFGARITPQSDTLVFLPFDGTAGDTSTEDRSPPRKYVTFYGSAALDTNSKFGSTSLALNGGQDRVEVALTERTYTTFTIEAWVNYRNFTTYAPIVSLGLDEDNCLEYATDGQRIRTRIRQGGIDVFNIATPITAIFKNVWRHYVLICDGTNMRFMIDGTTYGFYPNQTFPYPADRLTVGNFLKGINSIGSIDGYIDEVRLSKTVKYGDPYDPPIISLIYTDPPQFTIRNITGDIAQSSTTTFSINGNNFRPDLTIVRLIDTVTKNTLITSSTVTYVNNQTITATSDTSLTTIPANTVLDVRLESPITYQTATAVAAITVSNSPIWVTPSGSLGIVLDSNRLFSQQLQSTIPDNSSITYSLGSGTLPPGISISSSGLINGLAFQTLSTTVFNFTIRAIANNDLARFSTRTFSIIVAAAAPTWSTPAGNLGTYLDSNRLINITLVATIQTGDPISYTVVSGSLPPNTTLNSFSGVLFGTTSPVATDTTYTFTVRAVASGDQYRAVDRTFTITVNAVSIAFSTAASLGSNLDLSATALSVAATASSGTITYSLQSGTLPAGCSLNTSTGSLGTTTTVTSTTDYTFTIRATTTSANIFVDRTFTYRITFTTDGSTSARAGASALAIKQLTGTTTDGLYFIRPGSGAVQQIYCDMNTDGGGWMMIARSHPTNGPGSGWGWTGDLIGGVTDFTQAYQAGWGARFHNNGATFSEWIFGNRANVNNNAWGPFIYKRSNFNYTTFYTSDTQQSADYTTLKSNTSVYGSALPPGMQSAIGFAATGTANNIYYMRDCCGFSSYGGTPTGMNTTYCGSDSVVYYAGPWCGGSSSDGNGNFLNNVSVTGGGNIYGGTNQYMIMVR